MAIVKTYMVTLDSNGTVISTKEFDIERGTTVVVVQAKNPTNANKAALALRGE
jgi:hypothetical protein